MSTKKDFVKIEINKNDIICANYLANIRHMFEYRRNGMEYDYSKLSSAAIELNKFYNEPLITSKGNIAFGILAELIIYRDLSNFLYENFNNNPSTKNEIQKHMINSNFKYLLTIGSYDGGFDFTKSVNNKIYEIDIKNYGSKICNYCEIHRYNLFIDEKQYNNHQADIYVQTFNCFIDKKFYLVIAGYATKDMLQYNTQAKNICYSCKVEDLLSFSDLKEKYFKM